MKREREDNEDSWDQWFVSVDEPFEVYHHDFVHDFRLIHPDWVSEFTGYFSMPHDRPFLLQRLTITGLASDALDGMIWLVSMGTGRTVIEAPLYYYAIRQQRRIYPAWLFSNADTIRYRINFNKVVTTGIGYDGQPRKERLFRVHLMGQMARRIQ